MSSRIEFDDFTQFLRNHTEKSKFLLFPHCGLCTFSVSFVFEDIFSKMSDRSRRTLGHKKLLLKTLRLRSFKCNLLIILTLHYSQKLEVFLINIMFLSLKKYTLPTYFDNIRNVVTLVMMQCFIDYFFAILLLLSIWWFLWMLIVMKGAGKEYVTMDIVVINYKHDFSNRCLRGHHIF